MIQKAFQALESDTFGTSIYHAIASIRREKPEELTEEQIALLTSVGAKLLDSDVGPSKVGRYGYEEWSSTSNCLFMIAHILVQTGVQSQAKVQIGLLLKKLLDRQASGALAKNFAVEFIEKLQPALSSVEPRTREVLRVFLINSLTDFKSKWHAAQVLEQLGQADPFFDEASLPTLLAFVLSTTWGRPEPVFDILERHLEKPPLNPLFDGLLKQVEEDGSAQSARFLLRNYVRLDDSKKESLQTAIHKVFNRKNTRNMRLDENPRVVLYRLKESLGELDIALGFDADLEQTEVQTRSASYKWWEDAGFAQSVALEDFDRALPDVIDRSRRIYFNLARFLSNDGYIAEEKLKRATFWTFARWVTELKNRGIVHRDRAKNPLPEGMPYATEIELVQILQNPKWRAKTTFLVGRRVLSPEEVDQVLAGIR